jgi:hypothetical protein
MLTVTTIGEEGIARGAAPPLRRASDPEYIASAI